MKYLSYKPTVKPFDKQFSLPVGQVFLKFWFINKNSVDVIGFRKMYEFTNQCI